MNSGDESFTVSKKSADLLDLWTRSIGFVDKLKAELNGAQCSERNARNELGKWMCPPDAAVSETFHMWICDGLLTIKKTGEANYELHWRIKPTRTR